MEEKMSLERESTPKNHFNLGLNSFSKFSSEDLNLKGYEMDAMSTTKPTLHVVFNWIPTTRCKFWVLRLELLEDIGNTCKMHLSLSL